MKSSSGFLATFVRAKPLLAFFALTYIFVIVAFIPQALYEFGLLRLNKFSWYAIGALFSPAVAALIVQWLAEHNFKVCRIYDSCRDLVAWMILGPALILFSTAILPALLANKDPLHFTQLEGVPISRFLSVQIFWRTRWTFVGPNY
ncbi:MAG: hypothetical protein WB723_04665 [Candidatus Acidiferrales bacterium]